MEEFRMFNNDLNVNICFLGGGGVENWLVDLAWVFVLSKVRIIMKL